MDELLGLAVKTLRRYADHALYQNSAVISNTTERILVHRTAATFLADNHRPARL